jgi:ribonucleotide reductase beta subunit family protein with ferritin-like domain
VSQTVHLHDSQTLYRHWENEQWNPWAVGLAADKSQWESALSGQDKGLVYWALSSLMVAEERDAAACCSSCGPPIAGSIVEVRRG